MDVCEKSSLFDLIYAMNAGDMDAIFFIILKFEKTIAYYANYNDDIKDEFIISLFDVIKNFKI